MEPEKSLPSHVLNIKDLSQVLLLTLAMFVASILFGALMMFIAGPQWALLAEALLIVPAILVVRQRHMPFKLSFRFNAVSWPTLFYSFLIIFPVLVLGDEMDRLLNIVFPLPNWFDVRELLAIRSLSDGVLIVGNGVIIAALAEEMLFRGAVQPRLGLWFTSLAFALGHLQYGLSPALVQILVLGLILGLVRQRANTTTCIVIHGLYNLANLFVMSWLTQFAA
jgi:membrane protease YdiL (CAAX protease family)